ncbi:MAG: cation-translocating P-type ATPase [Anaerolineales bacterium]
MPQQNFSLQEIQDTPWAALSAETVLERLDVTSQGLSSAEARKRLEIYGQNALREAPPTTFWQMLWAQFNNFVVILLIVAALISALLGDYIESIAILAIVVLNAVLGVVQERNAEEALAALKKMAAPEAHLIRDGRRVVLPSAQVVPGDVVLLEAGNFVPADIRLLETANLRIEEAALTGESVPVEKSAQAILPADAALGDRINMAYMGTLVSYGRGQGVVVATGMQTQIGQIAEMLQSVEEEPTPLQRRLDDLGRTLGWVSLLISALVFLVGWLRGNAPLDMFLIAVSLAIAAVPEGLPAVVTISLALGMREMIKRHALIRRLASVETLGSATVICSDKTGTLTQNQMTVTRIWVDNTTFEVEGSGYTPEGRFLLNGETFPLEKYPALTTALWVGALNNDALLEVDTEDHYRMVGDPTEGALMVAAAKAGANLQDLQRAYNREQEIPFDSTRKRMVTLHNVNAPRREDLSPFVDESARQWDVMLIKGAPDIVLDLCKYYQRLDDSTATLDDAMRARIRQANDEMSASALRVLAMAYRLLPAEASEQEGILAEAEQELVFAGLLGMIDPPRPEVLPALQTARQAGIRTVMITGDYPKTAQAIAQEIGLLQSGHGVTTGAALENLSDEELQQQVQIIDVFARVSPQHKMRIVDALRRQGEVVAMTGDGVNDAPSIKLADIGVAMGITGTDVAKSSADMVLTDDNYASIVAAVEQGRVIYSNIRKFVYYLLSCNLAEIAIIFLATLVYGKSPLTAIQLLWLNLVTDGAPALALGTEKAEPGIMSLPPRPPQEPIINRFMQWGIAIQTVAITAVTLMAYMLGRTLQPEMPEFAETMAFVTLSISELARAYTARSERYPLLKMGIFGNRNMNLAFVFSLMLIFAVVYVPFLRPIFNTTALGWTQWEAIVPLLLVPSIAAEAVKYFWAHRRGG